VVYELAAENQRLKQQLLEAQEEAPAFALQILDEPVHGLDNTPV
jgi:hypothetical protein